MRSGSLFAVLLVVCLTPAPGLLAQEPPDASGDPSALRVYLDCDRRCDFDFLRQEVQFVEYVRDPQDADVHVIVTTRSAGSGREFQLEFLGRDRFEGIGDVVTFVVPSTDTEDEERIRFARIFAQGLVPYLLRTPLAADIEVQRVGGEEGAAGTAVPVDDPWNFWVFRLRFGGEVEGEDRQDEVSFEGSVSANRTTRDWKMQLGVDSEYEESTFEFDDGETLTDVRREFGAGAQVVRSFGDHWGGGVGLAAASSTFSNLSLSPRVAVAAEYNVYPYTESSRREITFTYFTGLTRYSYREETIFERTDEVVADHGAIVSLDVTRPWGEGGVDLEVSQFLNQPSKYRVTLDGNIEYRILRGLSVYAFGEAALVRDQLFLPRRGATDEEILLRRSALATDIEYSLRFGVTYTFGSIFNSIVNTRFSGASGGFHRIPFADSGGGGGGRFD